MELLLTFQNLGPTRIPIDYQYYLSSWLYDIILKGDEDYAKFLHEHGYQVADKESKHFKHFCFSWFKFDRYEIDKQKAEIEIKGHEFQLRVRFVIDEAMKHFVKGLFKDQLLTLKNGYDSQAVFVIQSVDIKDVRVVDGLSHTISCKTPLVIGAKQDNGNDNYMNPLDDGYESIFINNLTDKYRSSGRPWNKNWNTDEWSLNILSTKDKIRSKKVTIKPGTKNIDVRGFLFDFEIAAPREVVEVGIFGGFGKHCALGFGFGGLRKK
ncbi:MAG: CRISPR-associated endoribonuclease Cas6 [Halioglobus sp.]|jgi:CRISPR-associated endoribonuclease Cas6